ncbi:MAG: hypothetical protein KF861_02185 [Planctomycetaceae bacterium]|nr:hypothetical protein [Planctomycetaceae bacterium]
MHRLAVLLSGLFLPLSVGNTLRADGPVAVASTAVTSTDDMSPSDARLTQLLQSIVRESLPTQFEDSRHWGTRKNVVNGLDVEQRGIGLRISKRERAVRHGLWRKYTVTLADPGESLHLRMENLRSPAAGQFRWDLFVRLRANVDVRFEYWNLGVKGINAHANADVTLEMHADCALQLQLDRSDDGAVLVLSPTIHKVGLRLPDLDVHQFGALHGPAAEEIGKGLTDVVEKLLQAQEKSVRKRAQQSIDQHAADLRIPLADLFSSKWSGLWRGL